MSSSAFENEIQQMVEPNLFAAISISKGSNVDVLLGEIVDELAQNKIKIAGCLQREAPENPGCCSSLYLENIANGKSTKISQSLGKGSTGCRLDPSALAELSKNLSTEINEEIDLLVLNRFGKGESEGQGFRVAIEKAIGLDVPVLTAVRDEYKQEWKAFCGEYGVEIAPTKSAILDWCNNVLASRLSTN